MADRNFLNLIGLANSPVKGEFDIEHLKETHRRICEGEPGFSPGEFRPPVPPGHDRIKNRALSTVEQSSFIIYSSMDEESIKELNQILQRAKPDKLKHLKTEEFTKEIADIYARLDYIHPFDDGNSRTLRTFTRQLAKESGYHIDWQRFNESNVSRDKLYIARDNAVREIGQDRIQQETHKHMIAYSYDTFANNTDLGELLSSAIRPERARAWEISPYDALAKHPELDKAYAALQGAKDYFAKQLPGDTLAQEKAVFAVHQRIQRSLDRGEVSSFEVGAKSRGEQKRETTPEEKNNRPEHEKGRAPELDL